MHDPPDSFPLFKVPIFLTTIYLSYPFVLFIFSSNISQIKLKFRPHSGRLLKLSYGGDSITNKGVCYDY